MLNETVSLKSEYLYGQDTKKKKKYFIVKTITLSATMYRIVYLFQNFPVLYQILNYCINFEIILNFTMYKYQKIARNIEGIFGSFMLKIKIKEKTPKSISVSSKK